jgi:phosphoglycolate phosphatase
VSVKAVLFDLDGTLVNSLDDLTDAVNHMLAGFDRRALTSGEVRGMVGKGARNLVRRALGTESPEDVERGLALFVAFNTAHIADRSRLYPSVRELLEALTGRGNRLAIISNKQESLSRLILEALGIDRFFATICGGDTFAEMKPSPLPLTSVIERLGVSPAEAVMVGDSINDIQAGRQAGITTIGCSWGYGGPAELGEADLVADSCDEVATILFGLESN